MTFAIARAFVAGSALLTLTAPRVLAQAPPLPSATAPRVYRLSAALTAPSAERLTELGIDVLHYYGEGRYLLSAAPPAELLAAGGDKSAAPKTSAVPLDSRASSRLAPTAPHVSAYDAYPELRDDITSGSARRYEVEVVLAFPGADDFLQTALATAGFERLEPGRPSSLSIRGTIPARGIAGLLAHDYVLDVGAAMASVELLNDEARREHRVNVLHSGIPGAHDLDGEGVVIGVGDGGKLSGHPDIGGRVLYSTSWYNEGWGIHPDFVTGLIGADGTVDTRFRGSAPAADFVIESSTAITYYAEDYFRDYGMTLTNNSYGPYSNCSTIGRYYYQAATLDQQAIARPEVLHVFASGNSGGMQCEDLPGGGYGTILPGGQTAKNTLTVGNARSQRNRYGSSSAGPTFDGRLKPEIIAVGHNVVSNNRDRAYSGGSGTSYASPGVVGALALLTQHYGRLHGGAQPSGALLKAVACNTATDVGRAGPDFEHGFGLINGLAGVRALTDESYVTGSLPIGDTRTHTITVAEGQERVKLLLYYHDRPGATTNTASALVDDLDLALVTPAGDTIRPWVLDALAPAAAATRGRDSVNNIEQVTLDAPAPGTYRAVVASRRQDYGATDYVLTWQALAPSVLLTQPFGGESVDPQREVALAWMGSPGQTGTWRVEYAPADGPLGTGAGPEAPASSEWVVIERDIPNVTRSTVWWTPPGYGRFRFRVVNEGTGLADETDAPVTVIAPPLALAATDVCGGSARLTWEAKTGATEYEVYRLDAGEMTVVATTTDTGALVEGIPEVGDAMFSVAAVDGAGVRSPRAVGLFVARDPDAPCANVLPVTWREIAVEDVGGVARVRWSVDAEFENDFFAVERGRSSVAGVIWEAIGRVDGRGTSNESAEYAHDDAFAPAGQQLYYRVRQVDFDGTSEVSPTVAYSTAAHGATLERPGLVTLSQNLLRDDVTVTVPATSGRVDLELFDMAGRRLRSGRLSVGRTSLDWGSGLPGGAYVLRATAGRETSTIRAIRP